MTINKEGWAETHSGRQFFPLDPWAVDYDIGGIAGSLSRQARYLGHANRFYSVAEHSLHMEYYMMDRGWNKRMCRTALLHDATEAYLGDVPGPIKGMLVEFQVMEARCYDALAKAFDLIYPMPDEIVELDKRMSVDERAALMGDSGHDWGLDGVKGVGLVIEPSLQNDHNAFLRLYRELRA